MFIYFDIVVFLSAYFMIWLADPEAQFLVMLASIADQITLNEIAVNLLKALMGGVLIGVISIYFGARWKAASGKFQLPSQIQPQRSCLFS